MQIRESIKTLFPQRDCFSLVRPMSDEKQLAKLETPMGGEMAALVQESDLPPDTKKEFLNGSSW